MQTIARVAHLTSVHPQPDVRILGKQCATLATAGYDVTLVAPANGDTRVGKVTIKAVRPARGRCGRVTGTVRDVYRNARALDADLYHLHDPELLAVGVRLHQLGKLVVYDVHEDVPRDILSKQWIAKLLRRPIARAVDRLERAAATRLDAVVAAADPTTERFARIGVPAVTVRNYPILSELDGEPGPWQERERAVCYVGALTAIRGTLEMIDAAELSGVRLLLAGTYAPSAHREAAIGRDGWRWVEELGQLPRDEVAAVFARVRAGLVLVHPEPNHMDMHERSNKLFEYMSAGLPVIVSDFPRWRSFVETNGCGICVDPLDPTAIAAAIRRIVDDPVTAAEMGARGREAVRRTFNWDSEARKLLDLYATLLAS